MKYTLLLLACLVSLTTALKFRPLNSLNEGLTEISQTQYEASKLTSRSANNFIEEAGEEKDYNHYNIHYSKKQRQKISQAKIADRIMYGGKTFTPQPGHEMYFDFVQFREFAHAHTRQVRKQVSNMETRTVTNSSAGLITSHMFMGCIEINTCANPPGTTGSLGDACGMFGVDGTVTLETAEGKQTLKIGVSLSAGVAFKFIGSALTIFLTGKAEWAFEITGQKTDFYTSSYEALLGALKFWITDAASDKLSLSNNFIKAATNARASIAKANKDSALLGKPQTDELKGLITLHYQFIQEANKLMATQTKPVEAQNALKTAAIKVYFAGTGSKVTEAQCKCSPAGKQVEQVLMCVILTSAPLLPSNQQTTTWIGGFGSDDNFQNGFPTLYKEIWPTTEADVVVVKDLLKQAVVHINAIKPADWTTPIKIDREAEGKKFTEIAQAKSIVDAAEHDPTKTLRAFLQYLSATSTDLATTKFTKPNPKGVVFHFVDLEVTGTIGATLGSSSVGYCTADENFFQFQVSIAKNYNPKTGEWDGNWFTGNTKIWVKLKMGEAPIFLEVSLMPLPKPERDAFTFAVILSIPMEKEDKSPQWAQTLAEKVEPWAKTIPVIASAIGQLLAAYQGVTKKVTKAEMEGKMKASMGGFMSKDALKTAMTNFGIPMNGSWMDMFKGLGSKVAAAAGTSAINALMKQFGVAKDKKTIIEVALEFGCTGVSELKKCFPGGGVKTNEAELTLKLGVGITQVNKVTAAGATFYIESGNEMAYEHVLKGPAELE